MNTKIKQSIFQLLAAILFLAACKESNTVTDVDGNVYKTVKIGSQIWMAENLRVTKYRNGNPIFHVTDTAEWRKTQDGAWCSYNNNASNTKTYGLLYNGYAISDSRNVAPEGWHVPHADEITQLVAALKGDTIAAGKMKISGMEVWLKPNTGATNESGFSALPGGYRSGGGTFHTLKSNGYWWSDTKSYEMYSWSSRLYDLFADIQRDPQYLNYGLALRCVKD
ncbi:MAG: fibrobacter succinogenes major paralogous domain-containing protein [Sphingobacteriaceae bacterium]|nr:fibrobacter succinogenes major paralogous domain-containing protein [Sphingobacteriaceae bacterium]